MMKKLITAATIAGTILLASFSASAAPVTAGGITWDDDTTPSDGGITAQAKFQQWFIDPVATPTSSANGVDVLNAGVSGGAVLGSVGSELVGVGEYNTFSNGRDNTNAPTFCTGCELTFSFGGLVITSIDMNDVPTFSTAGAWFNIYFDDGTDITNLDGTPNFDGLGLTDTTLADDAYTKYAEAQDGELWGAFEFDTFAVTIGNIFGGFSDSTLSIVGGRADVMAALDYNNPLFGGSDLSLTNSATFGLDAFHSTDSNGQMVGFSVVPEPTSLAIFGLGLLGLAGAARRKQA